VGLVTLSQAEGACEVAGQELDILDVGDQSLVDGLLVGRTSAADLLLLSLLSLLEESLLTSLLLGLLGGEVLGLRNLLNLLLVEAADVDLVGGGDNVAGVDAAQGNTVDLEGTGNQEDTLVKGLDKDDTLAAEAAGEQDQDGTGLEGLARGPGADGLADLLGLVVIVVRVPLLGLLVGGGNLPGRLSELLGRGRRHGDSLRWCR
jgi:hypothetical protein